MQAIAEVHLKANQERAARMQKEDWWNPSTWGQSDKPAPKPGEPGYRADRDPNYARSDRRSSSMTNDSTTTSTAVPSTPAPKPPAVSASNQGSPDAAAAASNISTSAGAGRGSSSGNQGPGGGAGRGSVVEPAGARAAAAAPKPVAPPMPTPRPAGLGTVPKPAAPAIKAAPAPVAPKPAPAAPTASTSSLIKPGMDIPQQRAALQGSAKPDMNYEDGGPTTKSKKSVKEETSSLVAAFLRLQESNPNNMFEAAKKMKGVCPDCGKKNCGCEEMEEELKGGQKNLDVAPPFGKLTKADFDKLRDRKKSMKEEAEDLEEASMDFAKMAAYHNVMANKHAERGGMDSDHSEAEEAHKKALRMNKFADETSSNSDIIAARRATQAANDATKRCGGALAKMVQEQYLGELTGIHNNKRSIRRALEKIETKTGDLATKFLKKGDLDTGEKYARRADRAGNYLDDKNMSEGIFDFESIDELFTEKELAHFAAILEGNAPSVAPARDDIAKRSDKHNTNSDYGMDEEAEESAKKRGVKAGTKRGAYKKGGDEDQPRSIDSVTSQIQSAQSHGKVHPETKEYTLAHPVTGKEFKVPGKEARAHYEKYHNTEKPRDKEALETSFLSKHSGDSRRTS